MTYRDREPDVDTPSFRLWVAKPGEKEPEVDEGSVLTIDYSAGEKVYEQRVYGGCAGKSGRVCYSDLSASIGLRREAFQAG